MPGPLTKVTFEDLSPTFANTITAALTGSVPKIVSLSYPGNDTAADPAGGQTITINGANFASGCSVWIANVAVGVVSFVNANTVTFVSPVKAASTYTMYLINPDGAFAAVLPGIVYSNMPVWSTASGSLGTFDGGGAISTNLAATGDGSITYSLAAGNTLPNGVTLAANGLISGTLPNVFSNTTYTFSVVATDQENQDTTRQFSITANFSFLVATGGTVTTIGTDKIHTFTSNSNFVVTSGAMSNVRALVVAGGGGSGGQYNGTGSGAGGGGVLHTTTMSVTPGTYAVVVGGGGAVESNGGNSSFNGLLAQGGGGSGTVNPTTLVSAPKSGGSGAGAVRFNTTSTSPQGTGVNGQGFRGGQNVPTTISWLSNFTIQCAGSAGGGAGGVPTEQVGNDFPQGGLDRGPAVNNDITGTSIPYGFGGYGQFFYNTSSTGIAGVPSYGGANGYGHGATSGVNSGGASGAPGVVIIRYRYTYEEDTIYVKLYGAPSGTTFTDSSSYNHTVTRTGTLITGSSTAKNGGNSIFINNANGATDYLTVDISNRNTNFANNSWALGFWFRPAAQTDLDHYTVGLMTSSDVLISGIEVSVRASSSTSSVGPSWTGPTGGSHSGAGLRTSSINILANNWYFIRFSHTANTTTFTLNIYDANSTLITGFTGDWSTVSSQFAWSYVSSNIAKIKFNYQPNVGSMCNGYIDSFYFASGANAASFTIPAIPTSEPF